MQKIIKRILQVIFILIIIAGIAYYGHKAYLYIIADATHRMRKSIADTINPLKWPGKLFGGGTK